jgi:hypothetical protein
MKRLIMPLIVIAILAFGLAACDGEKTEKWRLDRLADDLATAEQQNRDLERRLAEAVSDAGAAEQTRTRLEKAEARVAELERTPGATRLAGEPAVDPAAVRPLLAEALSAVNDAGARLTRLEESVPREDIVDEAPSKSLSTAAERISRVAEALGFDPETLVDR